VQALFQRSRELWKIARSQKVELVESV